MSWTLQPTQLTTADRALLQRIINLYHRRLLAAWKTVTNGTEAVPDTHIDPPSIADWSNGQIRKALQNFQEHLKWFEVTEDGEPTPDTTALKGTEWRLLYHALRLLRSNTPVTQNFRTRIIRKCEPDLLRWESTSYPTLKVRWDRFRSERN
ncbi:hypothetical protein EDC01DRAFT_665524 [Geopyxis carbonaria]|nr:hypothetical protein EDC01DRAFT_665524 [Geopyxis carbonaria]